MKRKAIELYSDDNFNIVETPEGTRIFGMVSYPGISRNLKLYTIDQVMNGHDLDLPIWLNHAEPIGIDNVGYDLLPDDYRKRLLNREVVILGSVHFTFNPDTLQLNYEALVTDPFYKNPAVLRKMSVSQGVLHPKDLPEICDKVACYQIIQDSIYEEMSLVFRPGFSIATLNLESSIENQNAYQLKAVLENYMSDENNTKSNENCGCKKGSEVDQASGVMAPAGNCPEGQVFNADLNRCVPVNESGNPATNAGNSPATVAGESDKSKITKAEEALKEAQKALETANAELDQARKGVEMDDDDKDDKKDMKKKDDKKSDEASYNGPNADTNQRRKAQELYNASLDKKFKAMEAVQNESIKLARASMAYAAEHATKTASVGANTQIANLRKSMEMAVLNPKQWADSLIKTPEAAIPYKTWKLNEDYLNNHVQRKYRSLEGQFLYEKLTPLSKDEMDRLKAIEATDVSMNGGTSTGDVYNWQRTLSEMVLVYPDGRIVTPIQQFCETAILPPGKKQHLFYGVNVPTFKATDAANMDAQGSGYALAPSEIVITAAGGSTNPEGTLTRISFEQLEEIPIDLIQKINIGMALEAENRKNYEVLTTCYNNDTAYNPATDSIMPKGGGDKGAADAQGNTHWINGNSAAHLTSTDSGATSALTFAGLLEAKRTIAETGLDVTNLKTYLDYGGITQLLKDTGITTYTQRSVPEVITEGYIEKISGTDLIPASQTATGDASGVKRAVMFIPTVSFGFVTGRELQIDAERVARQQSIFLTASMKIGAFCKKYETTCRISFKPSA